MQQGYHFYRVAMNATRAACAIEKKLRKTRIKKVELKSRVKDYDVICVTRNYFSISQKLLISNFL